MYLRAIFPSVTFSLMFLQESWASSPSVFSTRQDSSKKTPALHWSRRAQQLQQKDRFRRLDDFGDSDFVCDPTPEFLFEGENFADLFSQDRQPVCDCGLFGSGIIDLPGFFLDNPVPTNEEELQSWVDTFNNDFIGDRVFEDQYGCKNQCSFCLDGTDACVLLDVALGGSSSSMGFEAFTIEEVTNIAADPENSAAMVDCRVLSFMESQFFRVCYTFTEGESGTVCLTTGERLFTPFCSLSVDGVECTSCEVPPEEGTIVADCSNVARAPAMIDSSLEDPSGVYAPLVLAMSFYAFEDNPPNTFGSCPANQEMAPPVPAPMVETTTTTPVPPSEPDSDTTSTTAPGDTTDEASSASAGLYLVSKGTVLFSSAMLIFYGSSWNCW